MSVDTKNVDEVRRITRQFILGFAILLAGSVSAQNDRQLPVQCWLWSLDIADLPSVCDTILVYQGDIVGDANEAVFIKRGLIPQPITSHKLGIVVRLYSWIDSEAIANQIEYAIAQWANRDQTISTVQIDFDVPSSQLNRYTNLMQELHQRLPNYTLSVTGLTSWHYDNPKEVKRLAAAVDHIAFQLYQVYRPHPNYQRIADDLAQAGYRYRLGITQATEFKPASLATGPDFQGFNYFISTSGR